MATSKITSLGPAWRVEPVKPVVRIGDAPPHQDERPKRGETPIIDVEFSETSGDSSTVIPSQPTSLIEMYAGDLVAMQKSPNEATIKLDAAKGYAATLDLFKD